MIAFYPACLLKEENGYTAVFPDWNNAATNGSDFNDTIAMAIDCLAGLIYEYKLQNMEIPKASAADGVDTRSAAELLGCRESELQVYMISVDADAYARSHFEKCVKKTVTIYDWQNREGMKRGINFSKVFQDALTAVLLQPSADLQQTADRT